MTADRALLRRQMGFVNDKLNDWDFIGVADLVRDEYECMVGPLTRMLRDGAGAWELTDYISGEITDHFGMGEAVSGAEVRSVVADLLEAWRNWSG